MADDLDGNNAQLRVIGEQLFRTWEAQHEKRLSKLRGSIPAWVAVVISLGTLIWGAAIARADVEDNTRRIEAIEGARIGERLSRIEGMLEQALKDKGH